MEEQAEVGNNITSCVVLNNKSLDTCSREVEKKFKFYNNSTNSGSR